MHPATHSGGPADALAVAVLGADAVIAALPATAVQLAHACRRAGYHLVVPASWGDELVAAECLRALDARTPRPAVMCTCPFVRRELLAAGPDLAPLLVPIVPPPVAAARYVHALLGRNRVRLTYIGGCPGGDHPDIDARIDPETLLAWLADRDIVPADEPKVFDAVLPPDRRRFFSVPGGVPAPEHLWRGASARSLVELESDQVPIDLAQHLLSHECALLDLAPALGCACAGVAPGVTPRRARAASIATEPPRAASAVVDMGVAVELADPVDTRETIAPVIVAVEPKTPSDPRASRQAADPRVGLGGPSIVHRRSPAAGVRAIHSSIPVVARGVGRSLPRAYVAARRRTVGDMPDTGPVPPDGERQTPRRAAAASGPEKNGRTRSKSKGNASARQKPDPAQPPAIVAAPRRSESMGEGPRT